MLLVRGGWKDQMQWASWASDPRSSRKMPNVDAMQFYANASDAGKNETYVFSSRWQTARNGPSKQTSVETARRETWMLQLKMWM
ncbi:hypothetical protein M406DRAFT_357538 [Cryphonectria parasitica EP155]|uniref:Uncharacterized protein n=1 Tax=Cryphonectria parasitica (strain ATCC 38755 / EP155) TaxID=660469 RepID=A0A9P5CKU5_CRYP1|nr:uncharacterized protein M406DRAFT_357538 [Cryphonectria parasitica EP155]KAF3762634.1 hypothetical protein M406DRAFT_357538 [Cryphonectria parasitica EP155]